MRRICKLCGKEFEATHNAQKFCKGPHYRKCKVCGKEFILKSPDDTKTCCSKECTKKLRELTMIARHGVSYAQQSACIRAKSEETSMKHFGVKHPAQSKVIKDKMKETCNERYGSDTPFTMEGFQDKVKETCLNKYGVEFTSQIPGRNEKMQKINLERYGCTAPMCNPDIQRKFSDDMIKKFGVPYYVMTDECRNLQKQTISSINKAFGDILLEKNIEFSYEFSIDRYSYDICIPNKKIFIEIDPTPTHNIINTPWSNHTSITSEYHLTKSKVAEENGYRCIHIFDWDDWNKVIDIISNKHTIFARKCIVQEVDMKTCNLFEKMYHLQSNCNKQVVRYGLYYNGELVMIMTFGKPRYNNHYQYELLRLCTSSKYRVFGGASKLFKHFLKNYNPSSIISYCDTAKFSGDVYEKIGMVHKYDTAPNEIWSKGKTKITNRLLLARGYDQLFGTNFGRGTNNRMLMLNSGWLPIYDCGQSVYIWEDSSLLKSTTKRN